MRGEITQSSTTEAYKNQEFYGDTMKLLSLMTSKQKPLEIA